jgi:hypothetical protein
MKAIFSRCELVLQLHVLRSSKHQRFRGDQFAFHRTRHQTLEGFAYESETVLLAP